jgi:hypothetical protein
VSLNLTDSERLDGALLFVLDGVREYTEGAPVEIRRNVSNGRLMVTAYNEGGNNNVQIDFLDLIAWLKKGPTQGRVTDGFAIEALEE